MIVFITETTENKAIFWHTADRLNKILSELNEEKLEKVSIDLKIADRRYKWKHIAEKYNNVFKEVKNKDFL